MDKKIRETIDEIFETGKPQKDIQLQMAIQQGYVPLKCSLDGRLVMALINSGENPCDGCNNDRNICGGRPRK